MPDITLPYSFAAGNTSDASKIAENIDSPNAATPDSFDVINGFLDRNNTAGPGTWKPGAEQLQHKATTISEWATGSFKIDWPVDLFNDDTASSDRNIVLIPGACKTFYAPYAGTVILVMWSVFVRISDTTNPSDANKLWFVMKAPSDDVIARPIPSPDGSLLRRLPTGSTSFDMDTRVFTGTYMVTAPEQGLYQFGVALFREASAAASVIITKRRWMAAVQLR